jgi:23S rRNA (cytosine1962-C5)-methyltransferase
MKIFLKKNEERRLAAGHQWIFSNEIERIEGELIDGGIASLYSSGNAFLGSGFYNKHSLIAFRMLTSGEEEIDYKFLLKRIKTAEQHRLKIHPERKTFRMVNSESDYLTGLIIDKFENNYSFQIFSKGMEKFKNEIAEILKNEFNAEQIIEKNDNDTRLLEGLGKIENVTYQSERMNDICVIDGIKYKIDLLKGQKTGFYLDQVFNRIKIRDYVSENSVVLDLFCNEGGFALNASYAGAKNVTAVDSSTHSIKQAIQNAEINGYSQINFLCNDVFTFFDEVFQTQQKFNVIVLDPPSFTKSKKTVKTALKGYLELNYKSMKLLHKNSFLFTYCCSHHISESNFEEMLVKAGREAGRKIQILDFANCTYDHPVLPQMSETKYLKGYILFIN